MANIELSMPFILQNEGGYAEPPQVDQPTNFGITLPDLSRYLGQICTVDDLKEINLRTATQIYKYQFWDPMSLDLVNDQNIATCIFDTGVNRGVYVGAIYAQQTCVICGDQLDCDGVIGPITIEKINEFDRNNFITCYEKFEWSGYQSILRLHPEDEKYRNGWESRCKRLLTLI